ncbi:MULTISPECIES: alpha/beta hydrolase [Aerococcus]|uniref:Alpha/beta hydrolase n=1 Tax=Aerococcus sanguinicola TaxID=119206 RepID=A0A5N1GN75_9LACT|nr:MULTISPECIES: alpha/beta hydrolase [Aerococcus]KAA9301709.1 alpha/beta hydrolase [Aerococcus sanguinicola]MDK6368878.1 alpha/beta hydrolase [Aerococcus sp. UMB9870]MDK6680216.1 alpha/beta hydrolase [Aerococcus sp. UMB8608]MDK6685679.1 alpha/beta hydrolase [Aerococcus sp. UMB8623]MDK6940406.1 alpha/beta hydrolase [Aerococcus sp. UMB8487]
MTYQVYTHIPSASKDRPYTPVHAWEVSQPRAILHVVHGMSEHGGRYEKLAHYFNQAGLTVIAHDQLGHGALARDHHSLGYLGAPKQAKDLLVRDVLAVVRSFKQEQIPYILLGNSMGAYVTRLFLKTYSQEIDACILSASHAHVPFIGGVRRALQALSFRNQRQTNLKLHRLIFGQEPVKAKDSPAYKATWRAGQTLKEEPLTGFVFTNAGFQAVLDLAQQATRKNWAQGIRPDLPFLIINGGSDPLHFRRNEQERLKAELSKQGIKRVTCQRFPGHGHELYFYNHEEEVFRFIEDWLEKEILPNS